MMDPIAPTQESLISSKEVLRVTGISRATLNNYIRMGILPKPIVQRPLDRSTAAKKIGFFPRVALDRIQLVQRLKREGDSMGAIVAKLRENENGILKGSSETAALRDDLPILTGKPLQISPKQLKLTLQEISYPAYLLNYDFEVVWINHDAQASLFKDTINNESGLGKNIFRLLFNWEFHGHAANWKDLVFLHMSLAKIKLMKTWIGHLYSGISDREIGMLEEIYDQASQASGETISETYVTLLLKDGRGESYRVIAMFFMEGILLVYIPTDYLSFREKNR